MPGFNGTTTQKEVIEAFGSQVKGRTFVITGAGQPSIGSQLAATIAEAGPAQIVIASRSFSKVEPVIQNIKSTNGSIKTSFVQVDLSDQDSVREAAAKILETAPSIDVLINSAGNMAIKDYTLDKQGIEIQFSVNHVGHFLLTNLLVPGLQAAAKSNGGARVVNLTSGAYLVSPVWFDDYNFSNGSKYQRWTAYGQAKTANILFAFALSKRLQSRGITSTAAHPGYNSDTELAKHLTWDDFGEIEPIAKQNTGKDFIWEDPRLKNFEQIAATPLIAALDPDLPAKSPAYLQNSQVTQSDEFANSDVNAENLWKLSEKLVNQEFKY
jgi:NAD(P)-dependent dehydrogenase (short-subunit alcohol dehydrogenase family)